MLGDKDCLCGGTGRIDDFRSGKPYNCPECVGGHMPISVQYRAGRDNRKAGGSGLCLLIVFCILAIPGSLGWAAVEWLLS